MKMKCFHYPQSFILIIDLNFNFLCYKKNYTLCLYYFDKRSTFKAHFVKLNQYFQCKLEVYFKYTLSILKVYFLEVYCKYIYFKYSLSIFQLYFRSILQVYFRKISWPFLGFICFSGPLYGYSSIVCG